MVAKGDTKSLEYGSAASAVILSDASCVECFSLCVCCGG